MSRKLRWISKTAVLAIHDRLIAEHGGIEGIIDEGGIEAALVAPRNHSYYANDDLFVLAAVYAYALMRNHPFYDGNKRVALTLAGVFLRLNGYRLEVPEKDAAAATQALSDRSMGLEEYALWPRNASKKTPRPKGSKR